MDMNKPACLLSLLALLLPGVANAGSDTLVDLLAIPGSVGLGVMLRSQQSPYKGAGVSNDLVPIYLYEGKRVFLHDTRVGIKLSDEPRHRLDLFLDYRSEGFPYDRTPASLAGMRIRRPSTDLGLGYRYRSDWGNLDAEVLHDVDNVSKGAELRLGYNFDWQSGRWHLRPGVILSRRNASLNNYYYGVSPDEAAPLRPAYLPGAGTDLRLGLYGYYALSARWRLLGGLSVNLLDAGVRNSPIVHSGPQPAAVLGAAYDFGSHESYSAPGLPVHVKLLYGRSTDCNLLPVMTLRCGSTATSDNTRIAGIELGRPLVERVNGWPLDFVGYVGVVRHDENGLQPNAWQFDAYIKAYYYGFPWSRYVRTRLGMGAGFSLAQRVPYVEERDQARRGRNTSKLLNYLDPSIDISVGDLIGARSLKETYFGVGASHRSGIFGAARMFGNINGGSNYLYTYIEAKI
ncbi:outer membrane protein OmpV precursor [mine drainage metagenome]|uniref:Outer membrane protein OmpV n=1 Tax=mine drainage metagenome TaxID=410659 RepID=A0A1J5R915_9ZZZZ